MQHPAFISGNFDTKFIDKHFHPEQLKPTFENADVAALAASTLFADNKKQQSTTDAVNDIKESNWLKNRKGY